MVKLEVKNTIKLLITLTIIVLIVICINYIFHLKQENIINLTIGITVIAGWFINSWLNRKNEIAKERRAIKTEYQKKVVEFWAKFSSNKIKDWSEVPILINEIKVYVFIYGGEEDIKAFQEFLKTYNIMVDNRENDKEKNNLINNFTISLDKFKDSVIKQYRYELELGDYNPKIEGRNI